MLRPRPGLRRGLLTALLLVGAAALPPGATATTAPAAAPSATDAERLPSAAFRNCGTRALGPTQCARVRVPIDRSGAVAGEAVLAVRRIQVGRRKVSSRKQAVLFLAGGPGQATTNLLADIAPLLRPFLAHRDLLGIDTRGTGRSSDLVVCPEVESLGQTMGADPRTLTSCARRLGAAAPFYGTSDVIADIEAVRRAAGYESLLVVGVSYGTYVAQRYAAAYPDRVSGLVLDSPVDVTGDDPFQLAAFRAVPRVHGQSCRAGACRGVTDAPLRDLARAVAGAPYRVRVDGGRGRRVTTTVGDDTIAGLVLLGDFDPVLRATLPGVLRRAGQGDAQPLARLARESGLIARRDDDTDASAASGAAGGFSTGAYVATTCRDTAYPWTDATSLGAPRLDAARSTLAALPAAQRGGFSVAAIADDWPVAMCAVWPTAPERPAVPALPAVPTLILSGQEDARTPGEVAQAIAARAPKATLVTVPGQGHSVISDGRACVKRVLRAYADDRTTPRCTSTRKPPRAAALPPGSPADLGRTGRQRAVQVARLSVDDAIRTLVLRVMQTVSLASLFSDEPAEAVRVAGLRSGTAVLGTKSLRLDRYGYVPGTSVTGELRDQKWISVRVSGRGLRAGTYRVRNPVASEEDLATLLGFDEGITIELGSRVRKAISVVARPGR